MVNGPALVPFPSSSASARGLSGSVAAEKEHSTGSPARHTSHSSTSHLPTPAPSPSMDRKHKSSVSSSDGSGDDARSSIGRTGGPRTPPPDYAEPIVPKFNLSEYTRTSAPYNRSTSASAYASTSTPTTRYSSTSETTTEFLNRNSPVAASSAAGARRAYSQTTTTHRTTERTTYRFYGSPGWDDYSEGSEGEYPFSRSRARASHTLPKAAAAGARFHSTASRNTSPMPSSSKGRSTSSSSSRARPTVLNNQQQHKASAESVRQPFTNSWAGWREGSRRAASMFASTPKTPKQRDGPSVIDSFFAPSPSPTNARFKPASRSSRSHSLGGASRAGPSPSASATANANANAREVPRPRPAADSRRGGGRAKNVGPRAGAEFEANVYPYVGSVVTLFAFLFVSALTCFTVTSIFFGGYTLTAYDDIRRGIEAGRHSVPRRIENMRAGMEKMLGNAKDALELVSVSWARVKLGSSSETSSVASDEEDDDSQQQPNSSKDKRKVHLHSATKPKPTRTSSTASSASTKSQGTDGAWSSDSDAQPYEVPPSTPYTSRPASPGPGAESGKAKQAEAKSSRKGKNAMPPRPPLKVLVPSVVFALVYTLVKLCWGWWTPAKFDEDAKDKKKATATGKA